MMIIFFLLLFFIFAYYSIGDELTDTVYQYKYIDYLGGHPKALIPRSRSGILCVSKDKISFWNNHMAIFEIPILDIIDGTLETRESLLMGKIVEISLPELKRNRQYVRIEFKTGQNTLHHVILGSMSIESESILQTIHETKIKAIMSRKFDRGEL